MIKISLYLTVLFFLFFNACGQKKSTSRPTSSAKVVSVNLSQKDENLVKAKIPNLSQLLKSKGTAYDSLLIYSTYCLKTELITSEDFLFEVLQKRESTEKLIDSLCGSKFSDLVGENNDSKFKNIEKELALIGIRPVFAEGQYACLADLSFLEDIIGKIGSEPFRLYINMKDASANSLGGEYSFMDLSEEMVVLEWGEKLIQKYPEHKYTKLAEKTFYQALNCLTDIHKVLGEDVSQYVIGGTSTEYYPMGTNFENYTNFIKKYPNSRFKKVVEKIVTSMSEVAPEKPVYAVVIDEFTDYEKAEKQIYTYLLQGIDIPHLLTISDGKYVVVYRFYADENKAQNALIQIKSSQAKAKIIKI